MKKNDSWRTCPNWGKFVNRKDESTKNAPPLRLVKDVGHKMLMAFVAVLVFGLIPAISFAFDGINENTKSLNNAEFSLLPPSRDCAAPTSFVASNIERRSATISWTAGGTETAWTVIVAKVDVEDPMTVTGNDFISSTVVDSAALNLTQLTRETTYYAYIQANCGDPDGSSTWLKGSFTTKGLTVASSCTYIINMEDSYGDGWNGNSINVFQDGTLISTVTLTSGDSNTETVVTQATGNGVITFSFYEGSYPGETICTITDGDGNELYSWDANEYPASGVFLTQSCTMEFPACPAIENVTGQLTDGGYTTGTISWDAFDASADYANGYDLIYCPRAIADFSSITATKGDTILVSGLTSNSQALEDLETYTDYYAYVRVRCDADPDQQASDWVGGWVFKTNSLCALPINLNVAIFSPNNAVISWENGSETQANNFEFVLSTEELASPSPQTTGFTGTSSIRSTLSPSTTYYFYLRNNCGGDDGVSPFVSIQFTTPAPCPEPVHFEYRNLSHNAVTLDWDINPYGSETQWLVRYYESADSAGTVSHDTISDLNQAVLLGLTPETNYSAHVQAYCNETEQSTWVGPLSFVTEAVPTSCLTVGTGSSSSNNEPVSVYYDYGYAQTLYDHNSINNSGSIISIAYNVATANSSSSWNPNWTIWMGHTDKTSFTSTTDWVAESDLTQVATVTSNIFTSTGWVTIPLTTPFDYNGTDNIVVAVSNNSGDWESNPKFYYSTENYTCLRRQGDDDASLASHPGTSTGTQSSNRSNIQFCFDPPTCPAITNLEAVGITTSTARVQWYPGSTETSWNFNYATAPLDDPSTGASAITDPYQNLTGLTLDQLYYVYVQADCSGGDLAEWVEYSFYTLPSCSQPTVTASGITATDAILNCTNGEFGSAQTYDYEYWVKGTTDTIKINGEGSTVTLSPLYAMTYYEYRAKVNCTDAQGCSRWTDVAEFKTECGTYTNLPFAEDFEANSAARNCWDTTDADGDTYGWELSNNYSYAHSGDYSIHSYSIGTEVDNWLISPEITLTSEQQLSWWVKADEAEHYAVYVIHNNNQDTSLAVWEETMAQTTYQDRNVKLRAYAGETVQFAFRHFDSNDDALHLDDVRVEDIPECSGPFNLTANAYVPNQVTLNWHEGDSETSWEVVIADSVLTTPASFDLYTPETVNTHVNAVIDGLTASTTYQAYVRSICDNGTPAWVGPVEFTTICDVAILPVLEDLTAADLPACWQEQYVSYGADGSSTDLYYGTGWVRYPCYAARIGGATRLVSLPISTTGSSDVQVSFYTRHFPSPGFEDQGIVLQYSYNGVDWINVDTIVRHSDISITKENVYKDAALDNQPVLFIGFLFQGDGSNMYTYLYSDIKVEEAPACAKPLGLYAENITDVTADLHWEGNLGDANYNIIVSETYSDSPDTLAVTYSGVSATGSYSYSLAGLNAQTEYYVWVQSVCGADSSDISDYTSFTTDCSVKTITDDAPYEENFDSYAGLTYSGTPHVFPDCWDYVYEGTNIQYAPYVSTEKKQSGLNSLAMMSSTEALCGDTNYVFFPDYTNELNTCFVSFYLGANSSSNMGTFDFGYVTGNDASTFTVLETPTMTTTMVLKTYSLAGRSIPTGARLAFRYINTMTSYVRRAHIDDVMVRLIGTSTNIAMYNAATTQGSASGIIDAENHRVDVQLLYGYVANSDITPNIQLESNYATVNPVSGTVFKWQNISTTADTTVVYTVTAENGATQNWDVHLLVESCASPITLQYEQTEAQNINFQWACPDGPSTWHFYASTTAMTQAQLNALTAEDYEEVMTKSYSLTSFDYLTQYYWYVRTSCGADSYSVWTAGEPFTTWEHCLPPTDLTLAVANDDDVEITWTEFENMPVGGTYTIYKAGAELESALSSDNHTDAGVVMGANYCYTIKSVCRANNVSEESDEVCIYVPNCYKPTNLALDSITDTKAFITWTRLNSETSWNVVFDGVETAITTDDVTVELDVVTYAISGLLSNTAHTFKVKSTCSETDESAYTSEISFTTNVTLATVPYAHGFEATAVDENRNWVMYNGSAANAWYIGDATASSGTQSLYISEDGGVANTYDNSGSTSYVYATRKFEGLLAEKTYTISFNWKTAGESSFDYLGVYVMPDNNSSPSAGNTPSGSWTTISSILNGQAEWQAFNGTFTVPTDGNYKLAFYWKNDSSTGDNPPAAVDNIRLYSCIDTSYLAPEVICYGQGYNDNGFSLEDADIAEGEHFYYIHEEDFTAEGCEAVTGIKLTQLPELITDQVADVCEGEIYTADGWNINTTDSTAGNHSYSRQVVGFFGCDSVINLTLNVLARSYTTDEQSACGSFTWINGVTYTESTNTPTHTLTNAAGCDSIVTLNLTILNNTGIDTQIACDSYTWIDGVTYTESTNTPTHTLANANAAGCDSVVTLNLTIVATPNAPTADTTNSTTCAGAGDGSITVTSPLGADYEYSIDGENYQTETLFETLTDGDYTLTVRHVGSACTNSAVITVGTTVVRPDAIASGNSPICNGETLTLSGEGSSTGEAYTYAWTGPNGFTSSLMNPLDINNVALANAGTYYLTVTDTVRGCDRNASVTIVVNETNTGVDVQEACDSFTWLDGVTYTESTNTPTWTLTNAAGCDSVVTLNLTIKYSSTGVDVQEHCDSYTWIDGVTYTESTNTPTWTLTNAAGCDSVVTLNLTIKNSSTGIDVQSACGGYTWIDGITYFESTNTPTFTLTNAAGCDSVVTLNLLISSGSSTIDVQEACDSYTWINGVTYTESTNTPTWFLFDIAGCDSLVTLDLTIKHSDYIVDTQSTCNGSYTWIDGVTYTESTNTPTFAYTNAAGCDSIINLNLTIGAANEGVDVQVACDSYTWIDNVTYTESTNTPTFTLTNASGCDSVVTLNLTINQSTTGVDEQVHCDSYTWIDGVTYTESTNTPTWTLANAAGCDSVVTLNLTITESTTGVDEQSACGSFTWIDGVTYTESTNTPTWTLTNAAGCDSIVTLHLTIGEDTEGVDVQTACGSFTWIDGVTYTESTNTPTWTLTNAAGCDSVVTLNLTINELPIIVITGDSVVVEGHSITLTASGAETYVWSTDETTAEITVQPIVDTEYSVVGTDANGCAGTQSIYIHVITGVEDVENSRFMMYPNPANNMLTIQGNNMKYIELYNSLGKLVSTTYCSDQNKSMLNVDNHTPGLYIVKIYTNNNQSYSLKLVVER